MKWLMRNFAISAIFVSMTLVAYPKSSEKFWTEKDPGDKTLAKRIGLPNFVSLVEEVDRAVVNISTTTMPKKEPRQDRRRMPQNPFGPQGPEFGPEEFFRHFFGEPAPQTPRRSLGSGFLINKDGYILTNNHVVEGADKVEVTLYAGPQQSRKVANENTYKAKIVGRDPLTDVALIKIEPKTPLQPLPLGDSDKLAKGEWVVAIGNPLGLDHTVTAGVVSAKGREINIDNAARRRFDDFIQTDAAINFGNSGGPMINVNGEVVGINTAISAIGSGIGFAIPINIAKKLLPELKEKGFPLRGYLGIMIGDIDENLMEAMGLKTREGVLVQNIVEDGPAAKADVKRGDIITTVDGKKVASARELQDTVAAIPPGKTIDLKLIRNGKTKTARITVGKLSGEEMAKQDQSEEEQDLLGLSVGESENKQGVEVLQVDPASVLAEKGITPGILITRITAKNHATNINSVSDYKKAVKKLKPGDAVVLDIVDQRGQKFFVSFKIEGK